MKLMFRAMARGLCHHSIALLTLCGLGIGAALLGTGGVYVASQSPEFCTSCHYMTPYYRQWESSTHADVSCVECHPVRPATIAVSALRYATGTHDLRPRAEVANGSCLQSGCHDTRVLDGGSTHKRGIHFDHETHLTRMRRGQQLQCTSCHSQVVQGDHVAVTEETCYLCHFKAVGDAQALGGCETCHGTPSSSVQHEGVVFNHDSYLKVGVACQQCHIAVTDGQGEVPQERCFACHVERLERFDDTQFLHATHVTEHRIDCFECHEKIKHGRVQMIRALESGCENCHQGLHSPQRDMYIGVGGVGTADTPSRMFAAQVSCDGCHTSAVHIGTPEFSESIMEAERQSCVTSHGSGYDLMLDDWQREMERLVDAVGLEMDQVETRLQRAESTDIDVTVARLQVERARHNYDLLKYGHGVHNVEYAVNLTKTALTYIDEAQADLDVANEPPSRSRLVTTPDGYCGILCHARLELPVETDFDHYVFPHALHVDDVEVPCADCHSPDKHKMRVITRSECMACHHEAEDIACGHCHPAAEALYLGEVATTTDVDAEPNFMAAEDVECLECHDLTASEPMVSLQQARREVDEAERARRPGTAELRGLVDEAEAMIRLVEKGKGAHNYELSLTLLEAAAAKLKDALGDPARVAESP